MTNQTEREKFEAEAKAAFGKSVDLSREPSHPNTYKTLRTQWCWIFWQRRAALDGGAVSQDADLKNAIDNIASSIRHVDGGSNGENHWCHLPILQLRQVRKLLAALRAPQQPSNDVSYTDVMQWLADSADPNCDYCSGTGIFYANCGPICGCVNRKHHVQEPSSDCPPLEFTYRNYRGEIGKRRVIPKHIYWGSSEYHLQLQWLLGAYDLDKQANRNFAVGDMLPDGEWIHDLINFVRNSIYGPIDPRMQIHDEHGKSVTDSFSIRRVYEAFLRTRSNAVLQQQEKPTDVG